MDKGIIKAIYLLSGKERELLNELRLNLEALEKIRSAKHYLYDVLEGRK
jgi:hypothetical protein